MKAINSGMNCKKRNENEIMRVTCKHCKKELEIMPKDVHTDVTLFGIRYLFRCSCCNCWIKLKPKEMSTNFQHWVLCHDELM